MKKLILGGAIVLGLSFSALAQQTPAEPTRADETINLSITHKQVSEENYDASMDLKLTGGSDVSISVGAEVRAAKITMTLKNIFGEARFHGSLERILDRLNLRRSSDSK